MQRWEPSYPPAQPLKPDTLGGAVGRRGRRAGGLPLPAAPPAAAASMLPRPPPCARPRAAQFHLPVSASPLPPPPPPGQPRLLPPGCPRPYPTLPLRGARPRALPVATPGSLHSLQSKFATKKYYIPLHSLERESVRTSTPRPCRGPGLGSPLPVPFPTSFYLFLWTGNFRIIPF